MNMTNEATFKSESELKYLVAQALDTLVSENIDWLDTNLEAEYVRPIRPDFLGKYEDGCYAIVELKMVSKAIEESNRNPYDPMRQVVGQCLHYFHALSEFVEGSKDLNEDSLKEVAQIFRIFIVTDVYAEPIENMCKLLRAHGFQINYIDATSFFENF